MKAADSTRHEVGGGGKVSALRRIRRVLMRKQRYFKLLVSKALRGNGNCGPASRHPIHQSDPYSRSSLGQQIATKALWLTELCMHGQVWL